MIRGSVLEVHTHLYMHAHTRTHTTCTYAWTYILYYKMKAAIELCYFTAACQSDFSEALFWVNSRRGAQVTQSCSTLHPSFRFGVSISRQCQDDGNWSSVDLRNCTMFRDSNPVIVVYLTTNQTNGVVPNDVSNLKVMCRSWMGT